MLNKLMQSGATLSRKFTMRDRVEDIWFEIEQQEVANDTASGVECMKGALRWGLFSLEIGNNQLGPFLNLDNLTENAMANPTQFNHVFEKIHKRYIRRVETNPILQLAFLLCCTIMSQHWVNASALAGSTLPNPNVSPDNTPSRLTQPHKESPVPNNGRKKRAPFQKL